MRYFSLIPNHIGTLMNSAREYYKEFLKLQSKFAKINLKNIQTPCYYYFSNDVSSTKKFKLLT